jgi:hypothetical protein
MPIVAKLDELGRPAWIALMILGFMVWWPIGLAALVFIIGSGRMSCWKGRAMGPWGGGMSSWGGGTSESRSAGTWWQPTRSSGNKAFDEYREDTLRRLEEEQREFRDFLTRLRMAKDKAEFDQFMAERRNRGNDSSAQPSPQQG